MNNQIAFSVLSYFPSLLSDERINVGVAIQNIKNNQVVFDHITKWNRVEHFDDELDIEVLKATISGIKDHLTYSLLNQTKIDIEDFTRFFVNELKFSELRYISLPDFDSAVDLIKKTHLRYDYDKHERLNENQEKKYLKLFLKSSNTEFKSTPLIGSYLENVRCDFVIDNSICLKIIKLNDNNKHTLIHHVKSWAYTSKELSDQYSFKFLISDDDLLDKDDSKTIVQILKSANAQVLNYNDYLESIETAPLLKSN